MAEYIEREAAMDVREKLVELIKEGIRKGLRARGDDRLDYSFEDVADYLISNGVTVQEWIPVTERLPERDKEVLLIVHGWEDRLYYTGCLHRQEAERSWLTGIESKASDWKIWGFSYLRDPSVTHWMPMPQPPKEVEQC